MKHIILIYRTTYPALILFALYFKEKSGHLEWIRLQLVDAIDFCGI